MSGSADLKRKHLMEEGNDVITVEDIFDQGKAISMDRYRAILQLVKDEQTATGKKHSAEVACNSIRYQIALLDVMLHMADLFDLQAEKDILRLKLRRAELDLQAIKVIITEWENNGEKWFWSEP
ncbi:hypothetical protein Bca4012_065614 [Brassica carinata]